MASWIKPVLISTGVVAVAMQLKIIVPVVALDFSRAPILFSSFLSWLKPPYLYVITNVIIVMIGFSSMYYRIITNPDGKDHEGSYSGDHKFHNHEQNVHRAQPRRSETAKHEDFSFVAETQPSKKENETPKVVTEKLAEPAAKAEEEKKCLVVVAKPENLTPVEKPLVSARIGQRKMVKTTTAERNSLKALRVAKPKRQETLENTWKMITEGKPLTSYYRRPDTFGLGVEDSNKTKPFGLKKAETLTDRTKYYLSPAVSRSRNELNVRAEAFIKKCNDERFEMSPNPNFDDPMTNDNQIESLHRKHHRSSSSSDEADKSSKRHKHRHHKHHHKRHHRHRRDKKREDEIPSGEDEAELMDVTTIGVSNGGGGDDVEEGEILDEEGVANVKTVDSDGESGEIKSDQIQDIHLPVDGVSGNAGTSNGVLTRESKREDKKESGGPSERVGKRSYDNGRSSFSSENSEEKYKSSNRSLTESRQYNEVRARSRSKSRVVAEDEFSVRGRHRDSSREYRHDRVDSRRSEGRGRYEGYDREYTREDVERERSKERDMDREGSIRDRDSEGSKRRERDIDRRREREREERREIEADRERRKDKERERSIDRDRRREREGRDRDNERGGSVDRERRREREGDYLRDRDNRRGRSRDRTRYDSRERMREKERESDKDREIQADKEKYKSVEVDNGERSKNENDQDDNDKEFIWKSPEEIEEEELNRIRESIEKFKKKSEQQSELISQDKGKDVVQENSAPDSASFAVVTAANAGAAKANSDFDPVVGDVAKTSLTAGGPPTVFGISNSEKTQAPAGLGEGSPKSERSADMFHDDIFGESPAANQKVGHMRGKGDGVPMVRSGLHDNWDDAEGYYSYQFGELIDGRYEVIATHGKGVFSTVVRAKDLRAGPAEPDEVAIKIIRNNETMHKAGQTEVQILKKLAGADRDDKRHCVRLLSSFKYRNHLCLVFESLHLNLRELLKKFGRNIGLKLSAVRSYSKQLFIALKHLKNCGVLHCDIKPDNMLVNENKTVLKLCDFGNAMFAGKNEVTPYLVSRFYRSPEIILGLAYDHPLDIWSVGCCLYELYCGKVLFPGATNNDMLRLHMELKGLFPKKMLRKGAFIDQHFDHDLNFYATEEDTVSGKMMKRMILNVKPKDFGSIIKGYPGEDPKMLAHFRDLLDKMFILDPEKRLTVSQALAHPFITGK